MYHSVSEGSHTNFLVFSHDQMHICDGGGEAVKCSCQLESVQYSLRHTYHLTSASQFPSAVLCYESFAVDFILSTHSEADRSTADAPVCLGFTRG